LDYDDYAVEAAIDFKREIEPYTKHSPSRTHYYEYHSKILDRALPILNKARNRNLTLINYPIDK
jgi:hypothetical protein